MSRLGSLYIQLGEPDGELAGCCETAEWAADYIESLRQQLSASHELIRLIFESTPPYREDGSGVFTDEVIEKWKELMP